MKQNSETQQRPARNGMVDRLVATGCPGANRTRER